MFLRRPYQTGIAEFTDLRWIRLQTKNRVYPSQWAGLL